MFLCGLLSSVLGSSLLDPLIVRRCCHNAYIALTQVNCSTDNTFLKEIITAGTYVVIVFLVPSVDPSLVHSMVALPVESHGNYRWDTHP